MTNIFKSDHHGRTTNKIILPLDIENNHNSHFELLNQYCSINRQ